MRALNPVLDPSTTSGYWQTELEAAQAFDNSIDDLGGLFRVYKEVEGRYQYFRPTQTLKTPRIDRILVPTAELQLAGWDIGPIGVELKKSGTKLGPPLCQLIDYTHATWNLKGNWIIPQWYFLWSVDKLTGPLQSILAGQRCGGVYKDQYHRLVFHSAFIIAKLAPGEVDVRPDNTNHGFKVGSR
jgi:hypothetical protein